MNRIEARGHGQTSRSVQLQEDAPSFHLDRVDAQRLGGGVTSGHSGAHVETALVQRALDLMPLQESIAQAGVAVRAQVVQRMQRVGDVKTFENFIVELPPGTDGLVLPGQGGGGFGPGGLPPGLGGGGKIQMP